MGWLRGLMGLFLVVLVIGGISTVAYQAGVRSIGDDVAAVTVAGTAAAGDASVVIVRDRGWGGFHPFGFFGFLLFGLFFFALLKGLLFGAFFGGRGRHGGPGRWGGPAPWGEHARTMHDEWHHGGGSAPGGPGTDGGATS